MNTFESWFKQILLRNLNRLGKRSIIVLDNVRFHRMNHLQGLVEQAQYQHIILPSPSYLPEFNFIEQLG